MFADLLLTFAIVTSAPAIPSQTAVNVDRVAAAGPSCMTGPIRVRIRTHGGTVQIAANAIRVEGIDHPSAAGAQPE